MFLAQLIIVILFLLAEVLLHTNFLVLPYKFLLVKYKRYVRSRSMNTNDDIHETSIFGWVRHPEEWLEWEGTMNNPSDEDAEEGDADMDVTLHPYVAPGLLFVAVTTLVLFFASGMYYDKIAYANQCVFY